MLYDAGTVDERRADLNTVVGTFYPLRRFAQIANTTVTGLSNEDCQLFLGWMKEGPITADLGDGASLRALQDSCVLRPRLLRRYGHLQRECRAW